MFLETAEQLAQHLRPAFDTATGIPKREVDFQTGEAFVDADNGGASSLAEATTIQMEFKYLSYLTQEKSLWSMAERPMKAVREATRTGTQDGLLPIFINAETGQFFLSPVRLGSRGDSYFEYLIKQYVQTNRSEEVYRDMFDRSMAGVKKHLIQKSTFSNPPFLFTSEIIPRVMGKGQAPIFRLLPKQDHLVCFLGGALMLGAHELGAPYAGRRSGSLAISAVQQEDWAVGHEVLRGCMTTYQETTTGLSPEISFWRAPNDPQGKEEDWYIKQPPPQVDGKAASPLIDARNILRPETVESLFVAFHLSGDPIYREWGWEIFQAFEKHCKLPNGAYAGIKDVDANLDAVEHEDKMVSKRASEQ
jgi:mannosyl-oligosaccharide alpha-1,2-mannosidase